MGKILVIFLGLVLVIGLGLYFFSPEVVQQEVDSFEECREAGYPVLATEPLQCKTPDGRSFTEIKEAQDPTSPVIAEIEAKRDLITVLEPRVFASITSPLTIRGEARGSWYFEGDFPVKIVDANGTVLGSHYATAQGEWMTENFVMFESTLEFSAPSTPTGMLILEKSNPSGLAENYDELRIPIRFEVEEAEAQKTVYIYHYNPSLDKDASGNVLCSDKGLVGVERNIPVSQTPIQDAIQLLLSGKITAQETAQGHTTEYPLEDFELLGASLTNDVLTLSFDDPNNATSGGSCRASILWAQIQKTAQQFDIVREVRFEPEELFQP